MTLSFEGEKNNTVTTEFLFGLCVTDVAYEAHSCVYLLVPSRHSPAKSHAGSASEHAGSDVEISQRRENRKAGDNVVVENVVVTKKTLRNIPTWWFQHNCQKNNFHPKIRDTIQFWTISICCWKGGGGSITNMSQFMSGWTHISSHSHIFSQHGFFLRSWVRRCWKSWRACPQQKERVLCGFTLNFHGLPKMIASRIGFLHSFTYIYTWKMLIFMVIISIKNTLHEW